MHKTRYVGCDVSKATLDVCQHFDGRHHQRQFRNTASGHAQLIAWLTVCKTPVRLVLEASGNYSLDLALTLYAAEGIDLMVANPSATRQFARAQMLRSKTDRVDASVLADFAALEFVPWEAPTEAVLELRGIARRMQALTVERTREQARLHEAHVTETTPAVVTNDIGLRAPHRAASASRIGRERSDSVRKAQNIWRQLEKSSSGYSIRVHAASSTRVEKSTPGPYEISATSKMVISSSPLRMRAANGNGRGFICVDVI